MVLKIGNLNKEVSIALAVTGTMPAQKNEGQPAFTTVIDRLGGSTGLAQTHVAIPSLLGNPGN